MRIKLINERSGGLAGAMQYAANFPDQDSRFKMFIQIIRTNDKIIQQYSTVWHIWYTQMKNIHTVDPISTCTLQTVVINIS